MEANQPPAFKKRPTPQFTNKGSNKRGKWNGSSSEQASRSSESSDTVYRILCHSRKIGSVIGIGGGIVKTLREETESKITVADTIPVSDERVIIIYSPSSKLPRKHNTENSNDSMELHCAAQDALLLVHDRIVEEDIGGTDNVNDSESVVTARLLVPNNAVGCLLGKKGDVIQRLRTETGANIRVLPADQLPVCAMSTDELVQISGKPAVAKRALYEVSSLLHQNPRKDKPPSGFPVPRGGQGFHPHGPPMVNMPPPPRNPMWTGGYGGEPSRFVHSGFDDFPPPHGGETPSEFSMKICCSAAKIGGVIGKGGSNVKQLQQETGASIHFDDASQESVERVIRVSSIEALSNPRSRTIDAILHLQDRTSESSEKGSITTRFLIPSSKVGCILGQGGHVINEMRRRTRADIRVFSKEDKPKCAARNEELVQVSGNYGAAKDALGEIASRYRARCLRDSNGGSEPVEIGQGSGFDPRGKFHGGRPPPPVTVGVNHCGGYDSCSGGHDGSSGRYEPFKGGGREYDPRSYPSEYEPRSRPSEYEPRSRPSECDPRSRPSECDPQSRPSEYEPRSRPSECDPRSRPSECDPRSHPSEYEPRRHPAEYGHHSYPAKHEPRNYPPVPPSTSGYPSLRSTFEGKMPGHTLGSLTGTGMGNTGEIGGTRPKLQDPYLGGLERGVDIRAPPQQLKSAQNVYHQGYNGQNNNLKQNPSYHDYSNPPAYPDYNSPQPPYHTTPNNPQQLSYDYYQNNSNNAHQGSYNLDAPSSYQY